MDPSTGDVYFLADDRDQAAGFVFTPSAQDIADGARGAALVEQCAGATLDARRPDREVGQGEASRDHLDPHLDLIARDDLDPVHRLGRVLVVDDGEIARAQKPIPVAAARELHEDIVEVAGAPVAEERAAEVYEGHAVTGERVPLEEFYFRRREMLAGGAISDWGRMNLDEPGRFQSSGSTDILMTR